MNEILAAIIISVATITTIILFYEFVKYLCIRCYKLLHMVEITWIDKYVICIGTLVIVAMVITVLDTMFSINTDAVISILKHNIKSLS